MATWEACLHYFHLLLVQQFWEKRTKHMEWALSSYTCSLHSEERKGSDVQFFCGRLVALRALVGWHVRAKTASVGLEPDWWVAGLVRCLRLCWRLMCQHHGCLLAHTLWGNSPCFGVEGVGLSICVSGVPLGSFCLLPFVKHCKSDDEPLDSKSEILTASRL